MFLMIDSIVFFNIIGKLMLMIVCNLNMCAILLYKVIQASRRSCD